MLNEILEIRRNVHQPLKWEDYSSTNIRDNTNAFAHAIGSTNVSDPRYYRLGMVSGKKKLKQEYFSSEEVKDLFLSDAHVLDLDVEEIIPAGGDLSKYSLLNHISKIELQNNQHIVVLFVRIYEDGGREKIFDFHFLRYDKEKGWSEKRFRNNVYFFEDISREWPSCWNDRTVGAFKITR